MPLIVQNCTISFKRFEEMNSIRTRQEFVEKLKLLANLPCRYDGQLSLNQHKTLKPWPDEDASWKLGSTGHFVWPGLARTWVDLRSLWSRSNLHPSQSKFFTVWPPNPSQRWVTSINVLLANEIQEMSALNFFFCDLRVLVRKFGRSFGHPTQVSTQVQLASTCDCLPVRLAKA